MKREEVFSVKIYFVKPVDLIAVVINTLLELEYETYVVSEAESEALLRILGDNQRSIVFLSVSNRQEAAKWVQYGRRAQRIKGAGGGLPVQVGAFVYSNMGADERQMFLACEIPAISFSSLRENTVRTLHKVLSAFDARGARGSVRVRTRGQCVAFVTIKGASGPASCKVTEISAYAMLCEVERSMRQHFAVGMYFADVVLALRGMHIRTAAMVLGFSKENSDVFVLRFCGTEIRDGRTVYSEAIPVENRRKIHSYIRTCLKEQIDERLAAAGRR
jgi:hypothetical protein